jgi:hypothetical protein
VGKRTVGGAEAARSLHKQLKRLFKHALKLEWIVTNPAELADSAGGKRGTRHTWTEAEIAQYRSHHALGTKARLALEIILWTGQRGATPHGLARSTSRASDRVDRRQGRQADGDALGAAAEGRDRAMPAVGIKTLLVTQWGKPFSPSGFGNWFPGAVHRSGLPDECRAHGLRKAIARGQASLRRHSSSSRRLADGRRTPRSRPIPRASIRRGLPRSRLARIIAWEIAEQTGHNG